MGARYIIYVVPHDRILPTMTQYELIQTDDYLGLINKDEPREKPFYIDFLSNKLYYRSQQAGLRKEYLARAIGTHPKDQPTIIDATAGLGRDSFILASLGYRVTLLEKSPIIHALLEDALQRARASSEDNPCHQLTLIHADALHWLPANTAIKPDVIYLDPMFPERKKSAAVKKDMQILNNLLGADEHISVLIETSLACAGKRVVVKRPRLIIETAKRKPDFSLQGKSTRFDIYLTPPNKV
jgi:16S rRNA (guanine1516-N2)-methyltransferase